MRLPYAMDGAERLTKSKKPSLPHEDLKGDLDFVLHLNHPSTNTDGRDSKISLFENGVCRVGIAGLFHGQADRSGCTVQRQIAVDLPLSIGQFLDAGRAESYLGKLLRLQCHLLHVCLDR